MTWVATIRPPKANPMDLANGKLYKIDTLVMRLLL